MTAPDVPCPAPSAAQHATPATVSPLAFEMWDDDDGDPALAGVERDVPIAVSLHLHDDVADAGPWSPTVPR